MAGSDGALAGSVIGAYQVGRLIGVGPLAEVYQAQHAGLPQPVALKVFAPSVAAHPEYLETMRETTARVRSLSASHILPVHDFGRDDKLVYLAMPLMHESLRTVLQRASCLPLFRAVPLLYGVAQGVAAAHSAGIIHRDLKPENVLLDANGHVFVSDFGIGRDVLPDEAAHRSLSTLSSLIGTPAYMAPEQLRGQPSDQRTDVYALGVIFYEMLAGAPPYDGKTIYEVATKALTTRVPPPSQRATGITPLLERAILRALARDPAARWPTAQRFIVGLDAALPAHLDLSDTGQASGGAGSGRRSPVTKPLPRAAEPADGPTVPDEASPDDVPTVTIFPPTESAPSEVGNSGVVVVPDLRLFRVDPLPPLRARTGATRLLLLGAALVLLGLLAVGGALLVNAAQSSHRGTGSPPTNPAGTLAPTQHYTAPGLTPPPAATAAAKPTTPPAPKPTTARAPTATPKPTATATPTPTATATPTPIPSPSP